MLGSWLQVERIAVNSVELDVMIEAMRDHKFDVMTTLLKQEYQRTIVKQQERMLASIGQEAVPVSDITVFPVRFQIRRNFYICFVYLQLRSGFFLLLF